MRGFVAAVARLIDELSPPPVATWSDFAPGTWRCLRCPALAAVYAEVEDGHRRSPWTLRGSSLQRAAANIEKTELAQVDLVLLDGFFDLYGSEPSVLAALARHAEVVSTLPPWPGGDPRGAC